jgi:glutamine amidotransferase
VICRISIVDYGMGNLFSVARAFSHLGCEVAVTSDAAALREAEAVLLPGVGAFAEAMARLDAAGLSQALRDRAAAGRPLFGVCLGMQLLFDESAEYGRHAGLGVFPGAVAPLPASPGLKIPHMGWNQVRAAGEQPILRGLDGEDFYFVHSFAVLSSPAAAGLTEYGVPFVSAAARGAVAATQFHPEKSSTAGLALYRNWLEAF